MCAEEGTPHCPIPPPQARCWRSCGSGVLEHGLPPVFSLPVLLKPSCHQPFLTLAHLLINQSIVLFFFASAFFDLNDLHDYYYKLSCKLGKISRLFLSEWVGRIEVC